MFLHSWHPIAIALHLGGLQIHYYGLLLAVSALVGFWITKALLRRYQLPDTIAYDLLLLLLFFGFLGARLYHVINEWGFYQQYPAEIFKIWNGGLALHGGIIAGALAMWAYTRIRKINFWLLADIIAPGLALAQVIGRWGNYFNQELFGRPTALPWGLPIDLANRPASYRQFEYFHPTFLYESIGLIIIFIILMWWHWRRRASLPTSDWSRQPGQGQIALIYVVLYSVLRVVMEWLRIDSTPVLLGIRLPIIVSLILIMAAVITWLMLRRRIIYARTT